MLNRRQHLTEITSHDNLPGISDLQQQRHLQTQSQQSQRAQQQPQSREQNPQNSFQDQALNKQQPFDQEESEPQEPRQQNQTEKKLQEPELAHQNLKQPIQLQQQNPELFRRSSDWDKIRTPEVRVIPPFQGERIPLQHKQKEPQLIPHSDFYLSPSRPEYQPLSERQLATSNLVLFETLSKRQPSAPQLEQRIARRHSLLETPRGPQRASQIQYQNMERRMSQISQKYQPQRDHNVSLPNTPQRGVTIRENKTTPNTPLKIPQSDQRRPSQEYRLNQGQNLEPPQREAWQQPSTSQFSGPSLVQPRNFARSSQCIPGLSQNQSQNYSSSIHCVVTQAPIQNYLAASQCVVGSSQYYGYSSQNVTGPSHGISHYHHASSTQALSGPTPGQSQYHGSSIQSISGPRPGPSQYHKSSTQSISGPRPGPSQYLKSSTQSIARPTPGPSQYHGSSTQSVSGPTQGTSQYHANSAQSVVGKAKYRGTLIQSGSGYDQSPFQYFRNPQSIPAPTHGQKYHASSSQSVAGLKRGQSNYQGHSSLSISVPTHGQLQYPSNTGQAITHTVSGPTQSHSHYNASAKKCASDSSQSSAQVSSQCQASSTKGSSFSQNLNSSDVSIKTHIVGPSHRVTETSQNQVQNVTPDRNIRGPSQNNDNSSQCDTNSTKTITQNNSSTSKGAIPKNYQVLKNDVSNKRITQSTASLSINITGSSEKTKETSQIAAGPSNKVVEAPKPKPSPPTKVAGPSHGVTKTSQNQVQNVTPDRNTPGPSQNNDNSSQCDTNSTKSITQNNSSTSKGAIPKNYQVLKNDVSNKIITQSTASLSINVAGSSEKTKESSQNAAGPSNKVVEAPKPKPTPPTEVAGPSHGVTETSQNQVQNVTPDRNTPGPSQNNDNSSQCDTNSTKSITQHNSSTSKGAIPKNYQVLQNDISNKRITQSTASLSNVAGSSEKIKETSQNAAGPSNKVVEAPKPKPSPPTEVAGPSKSASTSAKAKETQKATTIGPQPLMSSYSQLVSTLSQNKEFTMFHPWPLLEVVSDNPVETPNEMQKTSGTFAVLANTIPHAAAIFAKMKNTILGTDIEDMNSQPLEYNPIMQRFEVQEEVCNAGPEQVWRVHDAVRKEDAMECSVFMFDKRVVDKLYRPKRKQLMLDCLRNCINELHTLAHPRMLEILHPLEESTHTVAFATERIYASLHNILAWHESCPIDPEGPFPVIPTLNLLGVPTVEPMPTSSTIRPPFAREYHFLDIEIRYGFLQISEALQYMHLTMHTMHRNVCPYNVLVTRRGVWKLFGLEFAEPIPNHDPLKFLSVPQWSCKVPRICQPHLDYMAPETQIRGLSSTLADMYALGMILGALFNLGRPLINTNFNPILYVKQMEQLDRNVATLVSRAPDCLNEALPRLLDRDPQNRPTTQLMPLITYFKCENEPPVQALEALDAAIHKAASARCEYYVDQLPSTLAYIPKKLRWQNVWPVLQAEFKISDMIPSVLKPTFWLVNECTPEEFADVIYPTIRKVIYSPRAIPITIVLLENLHILTKKCTQEDALNDLVPMLLNSLDGNLYQIQIAALNALQNVSYVIPDNIMYESVVVKVKKLLNKNTGEVKIINLVLGVFEKILPRLDSTSILNYVVPTILNMKLGDPDVINRIVRLYKAMITEEKFGLSCDVMAKELIPKLAPQAVNPNLNVDQFNNLIEILYDMLENIERYQLHKLKTEGASAPGSNRRRIRQMSTENVPAPPFSIPNLRVEQRKTSSAENMVRRSSAATVSQPASVSGSVNAIRSRLGQWIFGSNNSTNNDGNFLRVTSILPNRRSSDNTLMAPKIQIAPSSASSPGSTPGGTAGLPSRRHSSIGPQERRLSTANLSPPTHARHPRGRGSGSSLSVPSTSRVGGGSMPNTSTSVPFLANASCRRPSGQGSQGGSQRVSQGSGILSHMVRLFPTQSATSSPRRSRNSWFQGNANSTYNSIRHSTNVLTRNFPSLNEFVTGIPKK